MNKDQFYFGNAGPWIPVVLLIVAMIASTFFKMGNVFNFCMLSFFALVIGFLLAKDKKNYGNLVLNGLHNKMLNTIFMAYIMAGLLAQLLRQSGLIDSLIWATSVINLDTGFVPVIAFVVTMLISTSCGTSSGSVAAVAPVLLPVAAGLNINIGLMCGAIISGAIFGDNLAPISDTTISSAMTQEADLGKVVRTRFPYAALSALFSMILFAVIGLQMTSSNADAVIKANPKHIQALFLLVIPFIMVFMMKKGWDLISTLLVCDTIGIILDLAMGCIAPAVMFSRKGPIIAGLSGMLILVLYVMLLFMVLEILRASGAFERLGESLMKMCKNARSGEFVIFLAASIGSVITGGSGIAILFFGPMVRQITKNFKIDRCRGANILDGVACGATGLMPHGNPVMLSLGVAMTLKGLPEAFSFLDIMKYNFHCWGLLLIFMISIVTGIGRKFENEEEIKD